MSNYVIKERTSGLYLAPPGAARAFTDKLAEAHTFETYEAADKERRLGTERIVPVAEEMK